jgi:hypothetical protein
MMQRSRAAAPRVAACALFVLACAAAQAAPLAHIEARVGTSHYAMKAPATLEESLAMMKAMAPNLAEFGRSGVFDRVGFQQTFIAADKSAMQIGVHLPKEIGDALKPGTYDLGGTTLENFEGASHQGWSSLCPDLEEKTPVLTVVHYGRPRPDAPAMPMVPNGDLERAYQTHHTRLHRDSAKLTITTVDLVNKWIEGTASGEVSWIVPKDSDAMNDGKPLEWMCKPGEYVVKTEPFELHFALKIQKSWP